MLTMAVESRSTDPVRAYVYALRQARHLSQPEVAEGAGMKRRTYIAWENGETERLDLENARSIVMFLGGAWEHLDRVLGMNAEGARALAEAWIAMSEEEQAASLHPTDEQTRQVIEISKDDPDGLAATIRELRNDARVDPSVLEVVSAYLAGIRAGRRIRGE